MRQLNLTICKSKGHGDLTFSHKRIVLTDEDITYIKNACIDIYRANNGNIDSICLDEWVKIFHFKDVYTFFIKEEIPKIRYYADYIPLIQWDPEVTTKNTFKRSRLFKILKCWSLGYTHVRTCWGIKEDLIPGFDGWYKD